MWTATVNNSSGWSQAREMCVYVIQYWIAAGRVHSTVVDHFLHVKVSLGSLEGHQKKTLTVVTHSFEEQNMLCIYLYLYIIVT